MRQFTSLRSSLLRGGVLCAALPLATSPAFAQAANTDRNADTIFSVGEIVVTSTRGTGVENVLSSVDILGSDVAQRQNVDSTFKVLGQIPGVLVTDFHQGGTNGSVSFRGFNAEGGIAAVKLLVDGVPSNSNDGYMWMLDAVTPLEISTVEVVRGTSDPRYGLHNIAGNVNVNTRQGGDYIEGALTAGSWATFEGQVAAGIETGNFTQNYAAAWRTTDGYRDRGDQERRSISGKWFYNLDGFSIGAIARYFEAEGNDSGFLSPDQAEADPRQSPALNHFDERTRHGGEYSLHADADLGDVSLSLKAYYNDFRDTRFFRIASTVTQQERELNETQKGAVATLRYHPQVSFLNDLVIEAGADIQAQDNHHLRWRSVDQVRTSVMFDRQFDLNVYGGYIQAIIKPAEWLTITPAWRLDWVDGDFTNVVSGASYPNNDYGTISQPKLSAVITPVDGVSIYGNYGRTFQIGLGISSYIVPPQISNVRPSINEGWEAGVKLERGPLRARLAAWQQTATGEILLQNFTGDFVNLGSTRRHGFDAQANIRLNARFDAWASYSYQLGRIVIPDPSTPTYEGNLIDHVPRHLFSGGVNYRPVDPLRLSANWVVQSKYEVDTSNSHGRYGDLAKLDLEAAWRLNPHLEIAGQVKNVTDNQSAYVYYDSTTGLPLHSPHDGRAFYAHLRISY